ncbi:putative repeat protein (TIGR03843 family) [Allocatelliglobosispora scoriae]|uniref:Putative repeat protein (TIGR03843 family) n=1 Tax=Allocatelliglobosispora scoriae TaxID=643052 RepID=A0A841C3B7_9ACTN|nr:SCO1664 family protein [Allocatelliglobosispora scoriae]MBB5873809.1 putative repeat protein (TIGR03843 family) [Allocatelliglobosispora scoriae]
MNPLQATAAIELLRRGEMEIEGRLVDASNATLRVELTLDGETARAVYKPIRGERPLWDFPPGPGPGGNLAGREVAAYEVSAAAGWGLVPPTILRDGPLGPGSVQLWLDDLAEEQLVDWVPAGSMPSDWCTIAAAQDEDGASYLLAHADDPRLATLALFDALINNADRKGAHVLLAADGHLAGIDHGVCFHAEPKLRTVLWGFAGRPIPAELAERLDTLDPGSLAEHLTPAELTALIRRRDRLREIGRYPQPPSDRHIIPWPPI